jgi:Xaa-Pro aminopeptidase
MTVDGAAVPDRPDLARLHTDRHARLQRELDARDVDGLLLLGTTAVAYATGAAAPALDSARAALFRSVAIVVKGDAAPHLFTPFADGAPPELPDDHVHGPLYPDLDEGAAALAGEISGLFPPNARIGVDELTHPMQRALREVEVVPAATVLAPAKLCKTVDELACIAAAQRINELAMTQVQAMLRPGVRQCDLTARFLRAVVELGAHGNGIDPIWQVMPTTRADGPWTTHGDLAFPTPSTDRILREGDVVWVDTGMHYEGYASDFGRTWLVGAEPRPTARQLAQSQRWRAVVDAVLERCKPGATGLELCRAATDANDGVRPWIEHFYLAHGVGTDSAEMPLIGTDLGEAFDEHLVFAPGMVLVIEPVIWDDGAAGYRSEDIVAITDDGWMPLSDHSYAPFGVVA